MAQVRGPGSPLRKVDASNVLELARDETGRVTAGIIDPGSTSGVDVPALAGIAANDPTEAVLLINTTDDRGDPLTGAYRYEMTFPGDMEPPVDALGR